MIISRFVLTATVAGAAILAPGLALAQAVAPTAQADAEAAYRAQAAGQHSDAVVLAGRALQASPDNLEWRLLLADALTRSGSAAEALEELQPVAGVLEYRVQSRRAEAAQATGDLGQAALAYGIAAPLAPTSEQRAYLSRAQVQALVQQDQAAEARTALRSAYDASMLPGGAPLDFAYVAVAAGDDKLAVRGFAEADALQPLRGAQALDAAYAARRTGSDRTAAEWLEQGARTLPAAERTPQRLHDIGREIQTLEHRFGGAVSLLTGPSTLSSALAASPGDNTTQLGGEAWARLGGDNNGRPVQGFVRAYQTLDSDVGLTGADSTQGWIGVRWKPFSETNLVVEASRMIALGDAARDDTAIRAAWSADLSGDLNYEQDDWLSARVYVDAVRLIEDEQTFAVADAQIGWTWVASQSRRDLITAGLGLRADYDSGRAETLAVAVGPRLSVRRWIGGDELSAPGRYVDVSVGYDVQVNNGPRDDGFVASITFGF